MMSLLRTQLYKAGSNSPARGFTLIEMSIVLVVIGLIIGGILKGQELIRSAQEKALIGDVDKIRAATLTFKDRYQAWPGDYSRASTRINALLPNGDGDGLIDNRDNQNIRNPRQAWRHASDLTNAGRQEYQTTWLHLSLSSILDVIEPNTSTVTDQLFPDGPHRAARFEMGYSFGNLRGGPRDLVEGTYIRYSRYQDGGGDDFDPYGVLRAVEAHRIDLKLDDGKPYEDDNIDPDYNASVFAAAGVGQTNNDCTTTTPSEYAGPDRTEAACYMFFRVE